MQFMVCLSRGGEKHAQQQIQGDSNRCRETETKEDHFQRNRVGQEDHARQCFVSTRRE